MKSFYSFVVLLAFVSNIDVEGGALPSYITPCSFKDKEFNACVKKQMVKALQPFANGVPELGVPSIDPVELDDIVIDGGGLKLVFSNPKMYGLSKSKVIDFKVNIRKSEGEFTLIFKCDFLVISKYEADGRILILPIQGKGDSTIMATGTEVAIHSKLSQYTDKTGDHLKLSSPTYNYTIENTKFDLQNLFNGNKELAETTIQFANDNWKQLMDELSPPAIKQIARTCVKAINKFFSQLNINQIVTDYVPEE